MPRETAWRKVIQSIIADQIKAEGLMLLGWREVPTDNSSLGESRQADRAHHCRSHRRTTLPRPRTISSASSNILRKSISQAIYQRRDRGMAGYYPCSMSCRTVIYKGMFLPTSSASTADCTSPNSKRAGAVHQRFSTTTFRLVIGASLVDHGAARHRAGIIAACRGRALIDRL